MWFGGASGEPGGAAPDPPEDASQNVTETAIVKHELGDLKDRFESQQALIGQLKDMLKKKETDISSKSKDVEDYSTRLAKMKPRIGTSSLGATKHQKLSTEVTQQSSESVAVPSSTASVEDVAEEKKTESTSRSKILLLRKQLEENRIRFERQQRENAEKRASMDDMKSRIERLRTEVEDRDALIKSLQGGEGKAYEDPNTQKLYQQLVYKDNAVMELTNKVTALEGIIQEYHETIGEKDKVIESKTEAVTLITRDRDEKAIKTLEELEETRFQMKQMQENFIENEKLWESSKENLSKETVDKSKKITQLEENIRRLENLRFELSARNAEMQEKIVTLQTTCKTLRDDSEMERTNTEEKDSIIQDLKQKLVRAESHGAKKLRAYEKQVRAIKHGNAGEQIIELQNRIAELEEEKGNLQLKLVDFDELKISNDKVLNQRKKLEEQVGQLNNDLDSQLNAITQLETEKINLVEGINGRENRIFDLESELSSLKAKLEESNQTKVTLELKLCELEEQRDIAEKMRADMENQIKESEQISVEQVILEKGNVEEALQEALKEKQELLQTYQAQLDSVQEFRNTTDAAVTQKDEKTRENKRLMNILTDKENTIATLSIKIDRHDAQVVRINERLTATVEELNESQRKLQELEKTNKEGISKLLEASKDIQELEVQLSYSSTSVEEKEKSIESLQESIDSANRLVNERNITVQNMVGEISDLQDQIERKETLIKDQINRLDEMESQMSNREKDIERLQADVHSSDSQFMESNMQVEKLKQELTNISKALESNRSSSDFEINSVNAILSEKEGQLEAANNEIQVKLSEIQNNQAQISLFEQEVCSNNQIIDDLKRHQETIELKVASLGESTTQREQQLSMVNQDLEEKCTEIEKLKAQIHSVEFKLQELISENQSILQGKQNIEEELSQATITLQQKEESFNQENSSLMSQRELQQQEITQLQQNLSQKEQELSEIKQLNVTLSEKDQDLLETKQFIDNQKEKYETELSEKDEKILAAQGKLDDMEQECLEKSSKLIEIQTEHDQAQELLTQHEQSLAMSETELNNLKQQLENTGAELEKLKEDFGGVKAQNEELTIRTVELEEQLQLKASSCEALETQMSAINDSSSQEVVAIAEENTRMKTEVETLTGQLAELQTNLEAYAEHTQKWQEWSTHLQGELDNSKVSLESTQKELEDSKEHLETLTQQFQTEKESLEDAKRLVGEELETNKSMLLDNEQLNTEKNKELANVQEELNTLINNHKIEIEAIELSKQQLQQTCDQHQQKCTSLQSELDQALALQQQSESEVASLSVSQQQRISQLEADYLQTSQDRDTLRDHLDDLKSKQQQAEAELNVLTAMMNDKEQQILSNAEEIATKVREIENNQAVIFKYEQEVCEKNVLLDDLKNQVEEKDKQLESLNVTQLETQESSANLSTVVDNTQVTKLQEEFSGKIEENKFLMEELDGLREDAQSLKKDLTEARQTIVQLQSSLAMQQSQQTVTSSAAPEASPGWDDWGDVDLEGDNSQGMTQAKQKEETSPQSDIVEPEFEKEVLVKPNEEMLQMELDKVETQKQTLSEDIKKLHDQIQEKDVLISEKEKCLGNLESNLSASESKIGELEEHLQCAKTELDQIKEQLNVSENDTSHIKEQYEETKSSLEKLSDELDIKVDKVKVLENEIQNIKETNNIDNTILTDNENLKAENIQLQTNLDSYIDHTTKWQEWSNHLQSELDDSKQQIESCQKELEERNTNMVSLNLMGEMERKTNQELNEELRLTKENVDKINVKLDLMEENTKALEEEKTVQVKEIEELKSQILVLEECKIAVEREFENIQQKLETTVCEHKEELEEKIKNGEEKLEELECSKKEIEQLRHELENAKQRSLDLQEEQLTECEEVSLVESQQQRISLLGEELLQATQDRESVRAQLEELTSKQNQMEAELSQSTQEKGALQEQLDMAVAKQVQIETELTAFITDKEKQLVANAEEMDVKNKAIENNLITISKFEHEISDKNVIINELQLQIENQGKDIEGLKVSIVETEEANKITEEICKLPEIRVKEDDKIESRASTPTEIRLKDDKIDSRASTPTRLEIRSLQEELSCKSNETRTLLEEMDGLRLESVELNKELQVAHLRISQLEGSLAVKSPDPVSRSRAAQWGDEWGDVDLGEQSGTIQTQSDLSSLQRALSDKDEMLQLMQEQLKDMLQQVNTITEEKKVSAQSLKSVESQFATQTEQMKKDQEELSRLKKELEDNSQKLKELQSNSSIQEQLSHLESLVAEKEEEIKSFKNQIKQRDVSEPQVTEDISVSPQTFMTEAQEPEPAVSTAATTLASNWFTEQGTAQAKDSSWQQLEQQVDQQQDQQQEEQQDQQQNQEEQHQQISSERAADNVNITELQFKLSWYEEQWGTWTAHFTQLQESYQVAEATIAQLQQQLKESYEVAEVSIAQLQQQLKDQLTQGEKLDESAKKEEIEKEETIETDNVHNDKENLERIADLESELSDLKNVAGRLKESEGEVNRLREFETQVYELQSHVQTLQHQCTAMQNKLAEAETERTRLLEIEALYGEVQSTVQASETKREGSDSRLQELELMVQSAESEISRLRKEIQALTAAGAESDIERERLQHEIQESRKHLLVDKQQLGTEMTKQQQELARLHEEVTHHRGEGEKLQSEITYYKSETERLQNEGQDVENELERMKSSMERMERENGQLRSELEVMEGEHERLRGDYEILEGENNRGVGDVEALTQANQLFEVEKESLESEVQRLTAQNTTITSEVEHLRGEVQRMADIQTSAEVEIARLRSEIKRFVSLDQQYSELERKYSILQAQLTALETSDQSLGASSVEIETQSLVMEEVDWGAEGQIEHEHLQRSSSQDQKLQEEVDNFKQKVISIEKEKNTLYDELQAAKLKSGKMLQKLKISQNKNEALQKEMEKLKKTASSQAMGGLDSAMEEEWKKQINQAESERDEWKQKADELENEKTNLIGQLDVLHSAQERYIEMKEDQDNTARLLSSRNKELQEQVHALEWRISELDESLNQQEQVLGTPTITSSPVSSLAATPVAGGTPAGEQPTSEELYRLKKECERLTEEVQRLKQENERLDKDATNLEDKVGALEADNEAFQAAVEELKQFKSKAQSETEKYKTEYIELNTGHERLKEIHDGLTKTLQEMSYKHTTLKAAYNSMYAEYNELRDISDGHKRDVGYLSGERDRLAHEVDSLKKQLEALKEEEEDDTIKALQEECSSLREQNNLLHEELTLLGVQTEEAKEKEARAKNSLEQTVEMQHLFKDELSKKNEELSFSNTTIEGQERQLTYMKAEIAALNARLKQQDQADSSNEEKVERLQEEVQQLSEVNQQLRLQVDSAQDSLNKLALSPRPSSNVSDSSSTHSVGDEASPELEAALASLHLRDLRCQQLSMEITKLLEERDALQLKLSASLRQTQELSRELSLSHQLPPVAGPSPPLLDKKLRELRDLNDSLEQKALENLQEAAAAVVTGGRIDLRNLPPSQPFTYSHTAPPTPTSTRQADYTISKGHSSRESQGTSGILIDWFMGKSTPKVMHV